jgi:hypothetical protein
MGTEQTKKKQPTKPTNERANKYEDKLTINGPFEDLVKELITPSTPAKKK